jgi:hypothetical protein
MTQPHHSDVIEDNIETHPVRLAIGVVIGAIALVVGIILLAQFAIGAYGARSLKDDPVDVAERSQAPRSGREVVRSTRTRRPLRRAPRPRRRTPCAAAHSASRGEGRAAAAAARRPTMRSARLPRLGRRRRAEVRRQGGVGPRSSRAGRALMRAR